MKTSEVLTKARELIEDPKRWTRYTFARDREGEVVNPCSSNAVCFCGAGAIYHVAAEGSLQFFADTPMHAISAYGYLEAAVKTDTISPVFVNDEGTHKDVLDMFAEAIVQAVADGD